MDQKRLPAPLAAAPWIVAAPGEAPRSDTERRLAAIWQTLLSVPAVTRTDGFFDLGGTRSWPCDSCMRSEQFGVALSPVALLQHQILSDLARTIDSARAAINSEVLVQMASGAGGTPFFWVHGIGGEVFSYLAVSKHLGRTRPVFGFAADWSQMGAESSP